MSETNRNTLDTLNNTLFATLETLSNKDLSGDDLKEEVTRAKAIKDISHQIVSNAALSLKAAEFAETHKKHKLLVGKNNHLRKKAVSIMPETMPSMLAIGPSPEGQD